jgi:hypothetical protein
VKHGVELGRIHLRHLPRHPLAAEPLRNVEDRHGRTLAVASGASSPPLAYGVDRPILTARPRAFRPVAAGPAPGSERGDSVEASVTAAAERPKRRSAVTEWPFTPQSLKIAPHHRHHRRDHRNRHHDADDPAPRSGSTCHSAAESTPRAPRIARRNAKQAGAGRGTCEYRIVCPRRQTIVRRSCRAAGRPWRRRATWFLRVGLRAAPHPRHTASLGVSVRLGTRARRGASVAGLQGGGSPRSRGC